MPGGVFYQMSSGDLSGLFSSRSPAREINGLRANIRDETNLEV